jgi:hypothetical protein
MYVVVPVIKSKVCGRELADRLKNDSISFVSKDIGQRKYIYLKKRNDDGNNNNNNSINTEDGDGTVECCNIGIGSAS